MDDFFSPIAFSLVAALCFAASQVTIRRGLTETSILSAVLISLTTALVVLGIAVALDPPDSIDQTGLLLFVMAGLAAPGMARWADITGIHRLGPSIATPITQGARPLLVVAGALLFLGEEVTLRTLLGLVAIIAGGWKLSRAREQTTTMGIATATGNTGTEDGGRVMFRPGIVFPLLAGLAFATSDLVVKKALGHLSHPRLGALAATATALVVWGAMVTSIPPARRQLRVRGDFGWIIVSGVLHGLALISLFSALDTGDLTLVGPITACQPLAVFLFSSLLLRKLERIRISTVAAGASIVVGVIMVSIGSVA